MEADKHLRELINVRADGNQKLIEANERLINVRAQYDAQLRDMAVKQAEALAGQLAAMNDTFRTTMDSRFTLVDRVLGVLIALVSVMVVLAA